MPISKSAKKSYRASERKRAHNFVLEKNLKIALKKTDDKNVNETIAQIDKAAKRHLISKNKAARLKSRLSKKFGTAKKELKTQKSKVKTATQNSKPKTAKKTVTKAKK